jgi:hypothetical protein
MLQVCEVTEQPVLLVCFLTKHTCTISCLPVDRKTAFNTTTCHVDCYMPTLTRIEASTVFPFYSHFSIIHPSIRSPSKTKDDTGSCHYLCVCPINTSINMQTGSSIYWLHHQTLTLGQLRWLCPCSNTQFFDDPSSHFLSLIQPFAPHIFWNLFWRLPRPLRHSKLGACSIGPPYRELEGVTTRVSPCVSFIIANILLTARFPLVQFCHVI